MTNVYRTYEHNQRMNLVGLVGEVRGRGQGMERGRKEKRESTVLFKKKVAENFFYTWDQMVFLYM